MFIYCPLNLCTLEPVKYTSVKSFSKKAVYYVKGRSNTHCRHLYWKHEDFVYESVHVYTKGLRFVLKT
jgi:hypothetical protein